MKRIAEARMARNNTTAMNSPISSTPGTSVSSSCVWGRLSTTSDSLLKTRAKHLETQMFYGPGFDPPVNNALVPSIYNKLDAQCQKRTHVINNVLDKRRVVQERVISRNRDLQERIHAKQTAILKDDLRRIGKRMPSFAKLYKNTDMDLLEQQVKDFPVPYSKLSVSLPEERCYCFRYFEHHNPVRIARRVAEGIKRDVKKLEQAMESTASAVELTAPGETQTVPEISQSTETSDPVKAMAMGTSSSLPLEPIAELSPPTSPSSGKAAKSTASEHSEGS
ncbi:bridging integrator 2-like [Liolophura sinensis]|uniref:bridging integrator 2-like n=1 Tax=Liolophura sinensis TaxID=3198878 RepID=UPI003159411C